MAKLNVRHLITKKGARGRGPRYFWQPSTALRAIGWKNRRLSDDFAAAIAEAEALNAELDAWRDGTAEGPTEPKAGKGARPGSLAALLRLYEASPRFAKLADNTKASYRQNFKILEAWAGGEQARLLTRAMVQGFYETLQPVFPAKANMAVRVLRVALKYGWDHGHVSHNAAEKPGLISTAPRLRVWSDAELAALIETADAMELPSIGDATLMGAYLGQRQGDLRDAKWVQYQDGKLWVKQSKRRAMVDVPATPWLAERLEFARDRLQAWDCGAPQILVSEATGRGYKRDHFKHTFAEVRATAVAACPSIADAWFSDLRDTAVTKLAMAEVDIPGICSITGHSETSAYAILKHYLVLNGDMAEQAIKKLVAYEEEQARKKEREG